MKKTLTGPVPVGGFFFYLRFSIFFLESRYTIGIFNFLKRNEQLLLGEISILKLAFSFRNPTRPA
jgi:hypothetical protein